MAVKKHVDWERIPVVIEPLVAPNPRNPYAQVDQAQRQQALRELARAVLLRTVNDAAASN